MFTIFTLSIEEAKRMVQGIKNAVVNGDGEPVAIAVIGRDRAKVLAFEKMDGAPLYGREGAIDAAKMAIMKENSLSDAVIIRQGRPDDEGPMIGAIGVCGGEDLNHNRELVKIGLEAFDYLCGG